MRLAIISTMQQHEWGGSEYLWFETAKLCLSRKYEVATLTKAWPNVNNYIAQLADSGASTYFYGHSTSILPRIFGIIQRSATGRTYWKSALCSFVKFKPSLILISMGYQYADLQFIEAIIESCIPYALLIQSGLEEAWPRDDSFLLLRTFYQKAQKCFFVSHSNMNLVQTQLACELASGTVVVNPSNYPSENPIRHPESMNPIRIACIARLDAYCKGIDIILDLMSIDKWRNRSVILTLYGKGINELSLKALAETRRLSNVIFAGHVANVPSIFHTNHAIVLSSRYEGLPIVIVEAMLAGKPVIATAVSGIPEVVEDNVTGFLAKAPTVELLDEAMERAWTRRNEWEGMGLAGQQRIRQYLPPNPAEYLLNKILDQSVSHETRT